MKRVIVLIFSLGFAYGLSAECKKLQTYPEERKAWARWNTQFSTVLYPEKTQVCIGRQYFYEIKGGAGMASALDRQKGRIVLRHTNTAHLRHELAHLYLDLAWKVLPYRVSEPFARVLEQPKDCSLALAQHDQQAVELQARWRQRHTANFCEMVTLLRDVLRAPLPVREALPLG